MKSIVNCTSCNLCKNQKPLLQNINITNSVFFVGLSAVRVSNVESEQPFSADTKSGALLRNIANIPIGASVYFTNLVKCLPLKDDKIRYPTKLEMELCFENLKTEISTLSPSKIVLFGRQVSNYVSRELDANKVNDNMYEGFSKFTYDTLELLAAPHPSYILIYKRKNIENYTNEIIKFMDS